MSEHERAAVTGLLGLAPDGIDVDADHVDWLRSAATVVETETALLLVDPRTHSLTKYPKDLTRVSGPYDRTARAMEPKHTHPPIPGEPWCWRDPETPASDPWGDGVDRGAGRVVAVRRCFLS
ncbi:hypothetical protein [Nocardioides campestrisoli]|uniref:hypothetical protein n=1 Tax=Nocardioides campestrisoli TaxID=2736757 RepID=UPI00163DE157|nr:hypothetical protein [Nocardioides campestrisoli]